MHGRNKILKEGKKIQISGKFSMQSFQVMEELKNPPIKKKTCHKHIFETHRHTHMSLIKNQFAVYYDKRGKKKVSLEII